MKFRNIDLFQTALVDIRPLLILQACYQLVKTNIEALPVFKFYVKL